MHSLEIIRKALPMEINTLDEDTMNNIVGGKVQCNKGYVGGAIPKCACGYYSDETSPFNPFDPNH